MLLESSCGKPLKDLWQACCPLKSLQQKTYSYHKKPPLSCLEEWRIVKHLRQGIAVGPIKLIKVLNEQSNGMVLIDFLKHLQTNVGDWDVCGFQA